MATSERKMSFQNCLKKNITVSKKQWKRTDRKVSGEEERRRGLLADTHHVKLQAVMFLH